MRTALSTFGLERWVTECNECHALSVQALRHSLEQGGGYVEPRHLRLLKDCMEVCSVTLDFVLRHSTSTAFSASVCAQVCHQCADSCARWHADGVMVACAAACRSFGLYCYEIVWGSGDEATAAESWRGGA
jgi:hypothetical protein